MTKHNTKIEQTQRQIIGELLLLGKDELLDSLIDLQGLDLGKYQDLLISINKLALAGKEVDTLSLYQENKNHTAIEITTIANEVYSSAFISQHIYYLKSDKFKTELVDEIKKSLKEIETGSFGEDVEEVKNGLIINLSSIAMDDNFNFEDVKFYKDKILEQINSQKDIEGYSWGIKDLDRWTSGIVVPRVYIIGGLKKSGKTRFLIHTLKNLHEQNIPTMFLSLEMPAYELTKLMLSSITGFNDVRFRSGSLMTAEDLALVKSTEINNKILGFECKSGLDIKQILTRIRRYSKMGFKVIALDYIQRINHDRYKQAQELEKISNELADAARIYNVALILLSQLNAVGELGQPNLGNLKGSGGIAESADTILLLDNLFRRTKKEEDRNIIDVIIEQRYGDSGLLKLSSDLGTCSFRDLATSQQIKEFKNETQPNQDVDSSLPF